MRCINYLGIALVGPGLQAPMHMSVTQCEWYMHKPDQISLFWSRGYYGTCNKRRLTGLHETDRIDQFTIGVELVSE